MQKASLIIAILISFCFMGYANGENFNGSDDETSLESRYKQALEQYGRKENISDYTVLLNHEDPLVIAVAAEEIGSFAFCSFGCSELSKSDIEILKSYISHEHPLVRLKAAKAFLDWSYRPWNSGEMVYDAIESIAGLLSSDEPFVRKEVIETCYKLTQESSRIEDQRMGKVFLDGFIGQYKNADIEIRNEIIPIILWVMEAYKNKSGLKVIVEDLDLMSSENYEDVIETISSLRAKEFTPLLKARMQEQNDPEVATTLEVLGEDVFDYDDFSSVNATIINFWKAIDRNDLGKAKSCLQKGRFSEATIKKIIDEHQDYLRKCPISEINFHISYETEKLSYIDSTLEKGYSRWVWSDREGGVFYYFQKTTEGRFVIVGIFPGLMDNSPGILSVPYERNENVNMDIVAEKELVKSMVDRIAMAIESYYYREGAYPSSFDDLIQERFFGADKKYCGETIRGFQITCNFDDDYLIKAKPIGGGEPYIREGGKNFVVVQSFSDGKLSESKVVNLKIMEKKQKENWARETLGIILGANSEHYKKKTGRYPSSIEEMTTGANMFVSESVVAGLNDSYNYNLSFNNGGYVYKAIPKEKGLDAYIIESGKELRIWDESER